MCRNNDLKLARYKVEQQQFAEEIAKCPPFGLLSLGMLKFINLLIHYNIYVFFPFLIVQNVKVIFLLCW